MIDSIIEIRERFNAIKDHKPRKLSKLNEIGEILSSAFLIDPDEADKMWNYIIDLNVSDDISFAKFYVAQVFNKITNFLNNEDSTKFISLSPKRIELLIFNGYTESNLCKCIYTLFDGFLLYNDYDGCTYVLDLSIQKSEPNNIIRLVKYLLSKSDELYKDKKTITEETFSKLCNRLLSNDNQILQTYTNLYLILHGYKTDINIEEYLDFSIYYRLSADFFDLFWQNRDFFSKELITDKWLQYLESLDDNWHLPSPVNNYEAVDYFVNMIKDNDDILIYYFKTDSNFNSDIIRKWVVENDWERFIKYISLIIINSEYSDFHLSHIYQLLTNYIDAYYYDNYSTINKRNIQQFQNALFTISQVTIGAPSYPIVCSFIKEALISTNCPPEILNRLGIEETEDPMLKLRNYVNSFLNNGELKHDNTNFEYKQIIRQLSNEKIDWKADYAIENNSELHYTFAIDDEISTFYFLHCTNLVRLKVMMIVECITHDNITRGVELIDLLTATVKDKETYKDIRWSLEVECVVKNIIICFTPEKTYANIDHSISISDDQKYILEQIIDYAISSMPELEVKIKSHILRLKKYVHPNLEDKEFINEILSKVENICLYSENEKNYTTIEINRIVEDLHEGIKYLNRQNRIDIIYKIMKQLKKEKDRLKPLNYPTWAFFIERHLTPDSYNTLCEMDKNVFKTNEN